ncbi:MAG: adenine phosphoribosyltransferase [Cyclobacteriaceae bacterium]|nr:adenine phosphoribosyltransferase [Cyclobacteriaceae bacterium]
MAEINIESYLRDVVDFPKPGIVFKDITPLLANPTARQYVVDKMAAHFKSEDIDAIAAVEARGFIFGSMLAAALKVPLVPVRKSGKLPYHKIYEEYALEYGMASIEMHVDAIEKGSRVLIHDDLLATGGTATAAGTMIKKLGGEVAGYSFVINLAFLPGEKLLTERFGIKPHYLVSYT